MVVNIRAVYGGLKLFAGCLSPVGGKEVASGVGCDQPNEEEIVFEKEVLWDDFRW